MNLWLKLTLQDGQTCAAAFLPQEGGLSVAHVICAGVTLTFELESLTAAPLGLPGQKCVTLRLARGSWMTSMLHSGQAWPVKGLRLCGFPLHEKTRAALANGYQCWSESPFIGRSDILRTEAFAERAVFNESPFYTYAERPGVFHSWSFSYSCIEGSKSNAFFGATDEDIFFTAFEFNLPASTVDIFLDTEGAGSATLDIQAPATPESADWLRLGQWIIPEPSCTDFKPLSTTAAIWMNLVRASERVPRALNADEFANRHPKIRGYTSWYYHYNAISEDVLTHNLEAISRHTPAWSVFQVDDGYQKQIGDWLVPSAGFPRGVQAIAQKARAKGKLPGIWCAPFIVMENSTLFQEHPEWCLRDPHTGDLVLCGTHGLWGGKFYALDTEHPEVRGWLENVFATFFATWDFAFLKADFLYAAARVPGAGLTRALRAARAHEFIYRQCLKHKAQFLSCGATLPSAYGRCDYSRIGADVVETWENSEFGTLPSREKVSTRATLTNTITRALLDGVAFGNDPDVVILRDNKQSCSRQERSVLAQINARFGSLIFCSDDVSLYDSWQTDVLQSLEAEFAGTKNEVTGDKAQGVAQGVANGVTQSIARGVASVQCAPHGSQPSHCAADVFEVQFLEKKSVWSINLGEAPLSGLPPHSLSIKE